MKEFIKQILQDTNGKYSSKRIMGIICVLGGIAVSVISAVIGSGGEYAVAPFSAGTLLLGVGTLEKPKDND